MNGNNDPNNYNNYNNYNNSYGNNNAPQYPYDQYQNYYYQQYYNVQPQQHIPQGDPASALSNVVYQLHQQTQQRQQIGAMAAASANYALRNQQQNHYTDPYNRTAVNYDDLSQPSQAAVISVKEEPAKAKTPPPPEKPKFCCNRLLKSSIAVAQHEKLHIKCPSCDFECLKSFLEEHEEAVHGKPKPESSKKKDARPDGIIPPNAPRINTPEELDAWIAARKKNWPSQNNVERKEKELTEKIARGEIVPSKKRKNDNRRQEAKPKQQKIQDPNSLVAQYESDSDDDEIMDADKDAVSSKDPNAMGKILLPSETKGVRRTRVCNYFIRGKCTKGDECQFSHEKKPKLHNEPKQPRAAPTVKKRPNLLFKLLEKEIRQEKSVILQCLRYIVDNNYLGAGGDVIEPIATNEPTSANQENETIPMQVDLNADSINSNDNEQ